MTQAPKSPIRPTDADARALAKELIAGAKFASLGVREAETGAPMVTRIAVAQDDAGNVISLVSDLSHHTSALRADGTCSLLLGEPGPKGDPLTHPRLTLMGQAHIIEHSDPNYASLAAHYLRRQPKAKLYIGFGDFVFLRVEIERAYLNGGFGKAFVLAPQDFV